MDIKQAKEEKQKLIGTIGELLFDFTRDTGTVVESVDVHNISTISDDWVEYIVDVEVSL